MPPDMIAIVDYGLGNLASVAGAVEKLGFEPVISSDPAVLADADKLILPGVGAFGDGMRNLRERGLVEPLTRLVCRERRPILGLCLGFQLFAEESEEFGEHSGLGWLPASVRRLTAQDHGLRLPHVGWNSLSRERDSVLWQDLKLDSLFYYVHSFAMVSRDPGVIIGTCEYGSTFVAAIQSANIFGTQFHPEKSQRAGLQLLGNFLEHA
jgi:imidazole glycerol-phosphate synthase subunit HisH